MNLSRIKYLYITLILISSLLYSYITVNVITYYKLPTYIALFISMFIEIIILMDTSKFNILNKIKVEKFYLALIVVSTFFFFITINKYFSLLLYFFYTLIIGLICLKYNVYILEKSKSNKEGITDISIYSTLSKIIGFALGGYIYLISINVYVIIVLFVSVLFYFFKIEEIQSKKNNDKFSFKNLKQKKIILNTAFLSGNAIFWIPFFIKYLSNNDLLTYSFVVFSLPGIFTILYLKCNKNYFKIIPKYEIYIYILLVVLFVISLEFKQLFIVQVTIFSLITALGISITINLRATFLDVNKEENKANIIQIFRFTIPIFLFLISTLGLYVENIAYITLLSGVISSINILFNKEIIK